MEEDDGWEDAFAPPKRRKMTQERAMLGDWAEDEDGDDSFGHFGGHKGSNSKKSHAKTSSSSLGGSFMFVSSGVFDLAAAKPEPEEEAKKSQDTEPSEEKKKKKSKKPSESDPAANLGKWERYTKGVGSKMLKKMGWSGQGLGVNEDGIVQPIQAIARAHGSGLDEEDYMGVQKSVYRKDEEEEQVKEEPKEEKRQGQWKKDAPKAKAASATLRAPKIVYKTKAEYEQEMGQLAQKQLVVDMRAPQTAQSSTMDISMPEIRTFLPQLRHNMSHLVDLCVNSIHSLVKKKHYDEQMVKSLKIEESGLRATIDAQSVDKAILESLKERLAGLKLDMEDKTFDTVAFFRNLKDTFPDEYQRYQLESLIFHHVFPRLNYELLAWRPLYNPGYGLEEALKWKDLIGKKEPSEALLDEYDDGFGVSSRLRREKDKSKDKGLDTYNRMVYEVYLPKLRQAISEWDVFDPDPALDLLFIWKPALSTTAYQYLLYHVVVNRLKTAVTDFLPTVNKMPLDTWILPWIPIMGVQQIPELLESVRRKLQQVIGSTTAKEGAEICLPFKETLDSYNWAQLTARGVLPKIESLLRKLEVDPADQQLEMWNDALVWRSLVSEEAFAMALTESGFWRNWFQVLGQWLHQPDVDLEQVQAWYTSWKQLFPKPLATNPLVQPQFRAALQLMLSASSDELPPLESFIPVKIELSKLQGEQQVATKSLSSAPAVPVAQEASLKELLEATAEDCDVLFMNSGYKHEGNPIFKFGKLQVYMSRDLVFCLIQGTWKPTSVSYLKEHCK